MTYTVGHGERGYPDNPVDGDLHYDRYAGFANVRYVEVDGQPQRVTHRRDGETWAPYDPGPDQFVITVPKGYHGPAEVVHRIVSSVLNQETRYMLDSQVGYRVGYAVAQRLGLDNEINATLDATPLTARVDDLEAIRLAVIKLLTFAPEHGYDARIGELGAIVDDVGYAENAEQYSLLIDGATDGFGDEVPRNDRKPLPLLSEPVYYALLGGKEDGRVMRAFIDRLKLVAGVKDEDL